MFELLSRDMFVKLRAQEPSSTAFMYVLRQDQLESTWPGSGKRPTGVRRPSLAPRVCVSACGRVPGSSTTTARFCIVLCAQPNTDSFSHLSYLRHRGHTHKRSSRAVRHLQENKRGLHRPQDTHPCVVSRGLLVGFVSEQGHVLDVPAHVEPTFVRYLRAKRRGAGVTNRRDRDKNDTRRSTELFFWPPLGPSSYQPVFILLLPSGT